MITWGYNGNFSCIRGENVKVVIDFILISIFKQRINYLNIFSCWNTYMHFCLEFCSSYETLFFSLLYLNVRHRVRTKNCTSRRQITRQIIKILKNVYYLNYILTMSSVNFCNLHFGTDLISHLLDMKTWQITGKGFKT